MSKRRRPVVDHTSPSDGRPRSRLLSQLPDKDLDRLLPYLKVEPLPARRILHQQGERVRKVYFPSGGVISMAVVLPDGSMVESALIGDDGVVGIEAFLTDDAVAPCETIVQIPGGVAEVLTVDRFRRELDERGALYRAVARYAQSLHAQMARLTACNALHPVPERCARWLLMAHDLMRRQDFHLSHEFLAVMLGVRRATVTVVAGSLQASGLIRYIHGEVTILDRARLEAAACECYPAIRALVSR